MRISSKFLSLLLLIIGLMLLAFPSPVLAQDGKVELTMRVLPGYYYTEITPGESKTLYVEIENTGNKAITNIILYPDAPKGWVVDCSPGVIDYLSADSHQSIDVNVLVDPNTGEGEYTLTLIAESDQIRTVTSTVLRVENGFSIWQWVGVGIGILVIMSFVIIYRRFGRE